MTSSDKSTLPAAESSKDTDIESLSTAVATPSSEDVQELGEAKRRDEADGGWFGWLQVFGCFLLSLNSWGIIYSYGAFQSYYQEDALKSQSASTIAWLGSIQSFLLGVVGLAAGPLYDGGYLGPLIGAGSACVVIGLVATSFCETWWKLLLAQAICVGTGTGCLYIPSVAVPVEHFRRRRALAMGVAQSGGAAGGIVYPIVFQQVLKTHGFAWATRALALIALVTCGLAAAVMLGPRRQHRRRSRERTPLGALVTRLSDVLDVRGLREPAFALFVVASFTSDLGLFGPTTYVEPYARSVTGMSAGAAAALLPALNGASIPGRIVPAALAGRTGPLNLLVPMAVTAGVLTLAWIAIRDDTVGLFAFAVAYGAMYGAYIVLPEVAIADMTRDMRRLGARIGICGLANALGSLVGTPIAGALLNVRSDYLGVQCFAGLAMIMTGFLLLVVRCLLVGRKFRVKA